MPHKNYGQCLFARKIFAVILTISLTELIKFQARTRKTERISAFKKEKNSWRNVALKKITNVLMVYASAKISTAIRH
jgi:hypothetical protein